jgi:hypothetical protein
MQLWSFSTLVGVVVSGTLPTGLDDEGTPFSKAGLVGISGSLRN